MTAVVSNDRKMQIQKTKKRLLKVLWSSRTLPENFTAVTPSSRRNMSPGRFADFYSTLHFYAMARIRRTATTRTPGSATSVRFSRSGLSSPGARHDRRAEFEYAGPTFSVSLLLLVEKFAIRRGGVTCGRDAERKETSKPRSIVRTVVQP